MAKRVRRKVVGCLIVAAGLGLLVWAWVARTRSDVPAGIRGLPRNGVFMDYEFGLRRGAFTGQLPAGYWESLRARAKALRELGAEFASAHVSWAVVEPDEGRWDFSFYRQFFQTLADEGLKIRFVLGQGPHGASTSIPTWYYAKHPDARFVNEDGQADTNDRGRPCFPSFWHPQTKPAFQRYLRRVRSGLLEQFLSATASYHLTFPGPYGEITYPQGHPLPHGSGFLGLNEMQRHFWCYDLWARRDFAARMKEKHSGDLAQLNRAWGTDRKSWDEV
ncbi:MAG: glycosyl hydrolase family protein, partial [Deltaproteobacteria bacterium]|nr:glycosyl hydrolase family protein [Deltaproteobacteria bacterium]